VEEVEERSAGITCDRDVILLIQMMPSRPRHGLKRVRAASANTTQRRGVGTVKGGGAGKQTRAVL
jgi:hypothetical protein